MRVQRIRKWTVALLGLAHQGTDVNAAPVQELMLENRRVAIRELCAALDLSIGTVHNAVHAELGHREVCARWVPRCLTGTEDRRFEIALSHLQRLQKKEASSWNPQ